MSIDIAADAKIDESVRIVGKNVVIGKTVKIYRGGEIIGPDVSIGEGTFINRDVCIRPGVTIGERVNLGPFVRLITDNHDLGTHARRAGKVRTDAIRIGDGAWIGASVTVLPGVTVGAGAVVAAGAVVVDDVPDDVLVGGVPARMIKRLP